jgi:F-type H+-transporting ATPase subunit delta
MINKTLVRRYTRGLINSISSEDEFRAISRQLLDFQKFLSSQKELQQVFFKSVLQISRKRAIGEDILGKNDLHPKVRRFLLLLIENGRLELLPEILSHLPEMWNIEQGITSFEISSVISLSDSQKKVLMDKLEKMEKNPVFLKYKIDPDLIGGVSIRQGNIVYDASLRGALTKLQEKISEG